MFDPPVPQLDCRGRLLALDRPRLMGIVNVTPDSFSDGGEFADPAHAVAHALRLIEEGADLIDVGGESTRPGAADVDSAQEIARVVPVIEALAARVAVPISVDTSKPEVMRAAVAAGAGLINDVRALRAEGALEAAADLRVPVCLMHMQGEPRTMQEAPHYGDVVAEVKRFLADRLLACEFAGIERKRLLVDPGFGFGKTLEHNLALLQALRGVCRPGRAAVGRAVAQGHDRRPDGARRAGAARARLGGRGPAGRTAGRGDPARARRGGHARRACRVACCASGGQAARARSVRLAALR